MAECENCKTLNTEIENLNTTIGELQDLLDDSNKQIAELEKLLDDSNKQIAELEKLLEDARDYARDIRSDSDNIISL
jgi:predicted  nucleic acid-binding Zn-ribbon protein